MAKKANVCIQCGQKGHLRSKCDVAKAAAEKERDNQRMLATMQSAENNPVDTSAMQEDYEYFVSICDSKGPPLSALMMYDCEVNKVHGTALADCGAVKTYISHSYAKKANVKFLKKPHDKDRKVKLPNGQEMQVLGYCQIYLKLSEWEGMVEAIILDILAEFDIILGMDWHRLWKPVPDWDSLDLYVNTVDGVKCIMHKWNVRDFKKLEAPTLKLNVIQESWPVEDLGPVDLISWKEAKKTLKSGAVS